MDISKETLTEMYRRMVRIREFELKARYSKKNQRICGLGVTIFQAGTLQSLISGCTGSTVSAP